jgi:dihydroorotate dehydrogenase
LRGIASDQESTWRLEFGTPNSKRDPFATRFEVEGPQLGALPPEAVLPTIRPVSWLYRTLIRPLLFAQDSEAIHDRTLEALAWASRHDAVCDCLESVLGAPALPVDVFGLRFPNPVGLAAGMDKKAEAVPAWESLGFGFVELGGVTWHPQPGNPAPRLFRAVAEKALINRMGFNNPGAEAFACTLAQWKTIHRWPRHPIGINLGKSKITPIESAAEDYAQSFRLLRLWADFFVVNVSSPNTPNLRQLQDKAALDEILGALQEAQTISADPPEFPLEQEDGPPATRPSQANKPGSDSEVPSSESRISNGLKPILVKVAPDLSFQALDDILDLAEPRHVAGIVATNTTIARPETTDPTCRAVFSESGGLSGRPLRERSTEVIRHLHRQTRGKLPIIGVGGIFTAEDAWEKIQAGASLVQLYTGMIYEGPGLAKAIVRGLHERLRSCGFRSLQEAVGTEE